MTIPTYNFTKLKEKRMSTKVVQPLKWLDKLDGSKTYIAAAMGGLVVAATYLQWLSPEQAEMLLALLGFSSLAALRHGVAKK